MKGIIIFNVDVGQASLDTTERIVRQKKEEYKELIGKLTNLQYETLVLTNRQGNNSIEKMDLS